MTVKIKKQFPKKELNAWLRLNKQWDHHDWLDLLNNLTNQGFHNWSLSVAGQKEIGFYLETRRR